METETDSKKGLSPAENALVEDFYINHFDELWRLASRILKDEEAAYDIVHSAFAGLIEGFYRIQDPSEKVLRSYLYVAVQHNAVNYLKKESCHPTIEYEDFTFSDFPLLEQLIDLECDHSNVQRCISRLKEPYKSYIHMKFFLHWNNRAIAEEMNKKEVSIRSIHMRAMDKLRKMLDQVEQGEEE